VPRTAGWSHGLERGDPVAVIGYPLGFDLPMGPAAPAPVVEPTLTVGTASKVLSDVIQLDAYGAPGSSGSPVFDGEARVAAVLFGGERESQGRIVYAVPARVVARFLTSLGVDIDR
jgi:S1-C subfamily serine protease